MKFMSVIALVLWIKGFNCLMYVAHSGMRSIAIYTENDEIFQRAFLRKYIGIIKTLNCTRQSNHLSFVCSYLLR